MAIDVSIDEFVKSIASEFSSQDYDVIIADNEYNIEWQSENRIGVIDGNDFQKALNSYYEGGKSSLKCDGETYALTAIKYLVYICMLLFHIKCLESLTLKSLVD